MTNGRDLLTKAETVMVAAIEAGVPTLVEAREMITQFHLMIRRRFETGLALQLSFCFEVRTLSGRLVSSAP